MIHIYPPHESRLSKRVNTNQSIWILHWVLWQQWSRDCSRASRVHPGGFGPSRDRSRTAQSRESRCSLGECWSSREHPGTHLDNVGHPGVESRTSRCSFGECWSSRGQKQNIQVLTWRMLVILGSKVEHPGTHLENVGHPGVESRTSM